MNHFLTRNNFVKKFLLYVSHALKLLSENVFKIYRFKSGFLLFENVQPFTLHTVYNNLKNATLH